ncbi:MAG: MBL fold metallo-hydrolase [Minisyncoccia bacterium]|mgnify:CR=1 FL=1
MKIKFYGGVNTVTGSNFILEGDEEKLMIDCGLIQKERTCDLENFKPFTYNPKEIKYIFITHAHLDHIGRLPKLLKQGFNGKILSTSPTKDLAYEILKDSLKVIEENCRFYNQENFYEEEDIEKTLSLWEKIEYHQKLETKEFEVEFFNAGHILGSAFILFTHRRTKEKIVFSGDLGNKFKSLDKDLEPLPETNYLVLESTYGDRNHENLEKRKEILEEIIEKVIREKRTLIIPTFALERAQEIIFDIQELIENKEIPEIKIFLDSPLAFRISKIYEKYLDYLDEEAKNIILTKGIFEKSYVRIIYEKDEEKEIFLSPSPKIILAGSGMVTGGRILDLLKKYIEDEKTTLLFVGFQAENSLGRKILEGVKEIFIDEKPYRVNSEVLNLFSYSAHRDQEGILEWLYPQRFNLKKVFLTHGDDDVKKAFKTKIMDELALNVYIPKENDIFEL